MESAPAGVNTSVSLPSVVTSCFVITDAVPLQLLPFVGTILNVRVIELDRSPPLSKSERCTPVIVAVRAAPDCKFLPVTVNSILSPFSLTLVLFVCILVYVGTGSKLVSPTATVSAGLPVLLPKFVFALNWNLNVSCPSVVLSATNCTVFVAVPLPLPSTLNCIVNGLVNPPDISLDRCTVPVASTSIVSPATTLSAVTVNVADVPSLATSLFQSASKDSA